MTSKRDRIRRSSAARAGSSKQAKRNKEVYERSKTKKQKKLTTINSNSGKVNKCEDQFLYKARKQKTCRNRLHY